MKIAFAGFRHSHILELYRLLAKRSDVEIVAASEDHEPTRSRLERAGSVTFTHEDYEEMLDDVECNAVAVGDYYGRRGRIAIAALGAGRHVILDKPICTALEELDRIRDLAAARDLCVGCMLNLRDEGVFRRARKLIGDGEIGEVHTVVFSGQHPLSRDSRPSWYFEKGRHGGTINDIAVHAFDFIPWLTGRRFREVVAARAWNARLKDVPFFQDGAQVMLSLDNGGGVIGDVSYLAPDKGGYAAPPYWRTTIHGSAGFLELSPVRDDLYFHPMDQSPRTIAGEAGEEGGYFESFQRDMAGEAAEDDLDTRRVLDAARIALTAQRAADTARVNVPL